MCYMKRLLGLLAVCFLFLVGCGSNETPQVSGTDVVDPVPPATVQRDTCLVAVETMAGNRYIDFTAGEQVLLRSTTGANWNLEVYDLFDCSLKAVYQLPKNFSEDYPYFLADINYNTSQRMVGIRGYKDIYVVDLDQQSLSKKITPAYAENRIADAESGTILHLEVWEDYLVGTTADWGAFVFSLDSTGVKPLTPVADLATESGDDYRSLFLIENGQGYYQAILPIMNLESGDFAVNPLFSNPIELEEDQTVYAEGSPYVRLKKMDGTLVGVNLYTGELLPVIKEVE